MLGKKYKKISNKADIFISLTQWKVLHADQDMSVSFKVKNTRSFEN